MNHIEQEKIIISGWECLTFPELSVTGDFGILLPIVPDPQMLIELVYDVGLTFRYLLDLAEECSIADNIKHQVIALIRNIEIHHSSWGELRKILKPINKSDDKDCPVNKLFNIVCQQYQIESESVIKLVSESPNIDSQRKLQNYSNGLIRILSGGKCHPLLSKTIKKLCKKAKESHLYIEWFYHQLVISYCQNILPHPDRSLLTKSQNFKSFTTNLFTRIDPNNREYISQRDHFYTLGATLDRRFSIFTPSLIRVIEIEQLIDPNGNEIKTAQIKMNDSIWVAVDKFNQKKQNGFETAVIARCQYCKTYRVEKRTKGTNKNKAPRVIPRHCDRPECILADRKYADNIRK